MAKVDLVVKDVAKQFGDFKVLKDINLSLVTDEVFGLLGPNAAGKSTLTKIMVGQLSPDTGSVLYYGKKLASNQSRLYKIIGLVPQEECFYRDFSVLQNLRFCGHLYGLKGPLLTKRVDWLLKWLQLVPFKNKKSKLLSGGYRRLLNMACSLLHDPKIIFMDEPTVGLDPKMRRMFWKKILELKEQGKTIVLTTHYMDEAEQLCDRIALMLEGKILVQGKPKELIARYAGQNLEEVFLALTKDKEEISQ